MLFTVCHKYRGGKSKGVGPDATCWPQSWWVIGRQDDGELAAESPAPSSLSVPPHSFVRVGDIRCSEEAE